MHSERPPSPACRRLRPNGDKYFGRVTQDLPRSVDSG
jgi:hypothetical protein